MLYELGNNIIGSLYDARFNVCPGAEVESKRELRMEKDNDDNILLHYTL